MELKIQKNLQKIKTEDHGAIDRLIEANVSGKLDSYLKRYTKEEGAEVRLSLVLEENKKGEFDGSLRIQADGRDFASKREDFRSLEDLVNHLFDHVKIQMADAK